MCCCSLPLLESSDFTCSFSAHCCRDSISLILASEPGQAQHFLFNKVSLLQTELTRTVICTFHIYHNFDIDTSITQGHPIR